MYISRKSLTLAELMIAIICIAMLITYGIQEFTSSAIKVDKMAKYDKGVLYALDAVEICKAWPFDRLDEDDALDANNKKYYLEHAFNDDTNIYDPEDPDKYRVWNNTVFDNYNYKREVDIKTIDSNTGAVLKLKLVTIIVKWWPVGKTESTAASYKLSTVIGK